MPLNYGAGEDSWESLGLCKDPASQSWRRSTLNIHLKDWCWSSSTWATWCEELTDRKRPWCWERLRIGKDGGGRGRDGWMASSTQWTRVSANSRGLWRIGEPGVPCSSWDHKESDMTQQLKNNREQWWSTWESPWHMESLNQLSCSVELFSWAVQFSWAEQVSSTLVTLWRPIHRIWGIPWWPPVAGKHQMLPLLRLSPPLMLCGLVWSIYFWIEHETVHLDHVVQWRENGIHDHQALADSPWQHLWLVTTWCEELTHEKRPWCWEKLKAGGEGDNRGWDGWMASPTNGHEFEQAPGVGDGQGNLVCYSPWGHKELDMTEWLNWTEPNPQASFMVLCAIDFPYGDHTGPSWDDSSCDSEFVICDSSLQSERYHLYAALHRDFHGYKCWNLWLVKLPLDKWNPSNWQEII